jgi:hypothetical protein
MQVSILKVAPQGRVQGLKTMASTGWFADGGAVNAGLADHKDLFLVFHDATGECAQRLPLGFQEAQNCFWGPRNILC